MSELFHPCSSDRSLILLPLTTFVDAVADVCGGILLLHPIYSEGMEIEIDACINQCLITNQCIKT